MNLSHDYTIAKKQLNIDDPFVGNDSPRVDHLIRVYTSQGASRAAITTAIQKATAGLLKVWSYTEDEIDMATVMFCTGEQKLVYAANHSLGLPSVNTICSKAQITHLLPSSGLPTMCELLHNITEVFGKSRIPMPICGHSLMLDEIALKEWPVFIKWLNSIGGLCQEHMKTQSLLMMSVPGLQALVDAIFGPSPTVHYAKEATIAGITAFRSEHYEVMAIQCLVSTGPGEGVVGKD